MLCFEIFETRAEAMALEREIKAKKRAASRYRAECALSPRCMTVAESPAGTRVRAEWH